MRSGRPTSGQLACGAQCASRFGAFSGGYLQLRRWRARRDGRQTAQGLESDGEVDDQYQSKFRAGLRLCAAMIGGSAVAAMAAIGLMVAHEHDGQIIRFAAIRIGYPTLRGSGTTLLPIVRWAV